MTNTFTWKNLTLQVRFQWSYGNDVMNQLARLRNQMKYARNTGQIQLRRWRYQGDVTDVPKSVYADPMENYRASSRWVEDGSYLRLKNVTLSYNWKPKKVVKNIRFSFTATNLLTWSKYTGYDPEANNTSNAFVRGVDGGAYPRARTYNLGVNMTF